MFCPSLYFFVIIFTINGWLVQGSDISKKDQEILVFIISFFFFFKFICFDREKVGVGGAQAERGREKESQAGSVLPVWSLMWGSNAQTMGQMT